MAPRTGTSAARRLLALAALPLLAGTVVATGSTPAIAATTHSSPGTKDLQAQISSARSAYELARARVDGLSRQSAQLEANAAKAEAIAGQLHDKVAGQDPGFFHAVGELINPGESELDQAADAADNAEHARQLADMVHTALAASIADTEKARQQLEAAQRRQLRIEAKWSAGEYAAAAIRRSQFQAAYAVSDPAQDARNQAALRAWHLYLHRVAAVAVVPPPAKDLERPDRLPAPLQQLRDRLNTAVPGVAEIDPAGKRAVPIVPTETVRAVSEAFRRVGLPTVPGDIDATTYACGGLLANAWGSSITLPADVTSQFQELHSVPVGTLQIGDVVVLGSRKDGLAQTAVFVGHGRIIVADPTTGTAGVQPLPAHVLGVRRATLPASGSNPAPPSGGVCGPAVPTPTVDGSGPLLIPLAAGSYRLSAGFGDSSGLWSSGEHTGQDLAAPIGTPVVAAAAGTVTVEHPGWAGNLVRIDHGGGVETWYAHLSRVDVTDGQTVAAGDPVGLVGDLGNTTGPHLHFEVRLDGYPVDPTQVLDLPEAPRPTYPNGEVPESALCTATSDGAQLLRCDAAVSFRLMGVAFAEANGAPLCITDSYRSRAGQERAHVAKPHLTATPGTSVHGWGLAVDLCGGIERFDTPEHDWLVAHGPSFGWHHPAWAEPGGSRPEPWHFEYGA